MSKGRGKTVRWLGPAIVVASIIAVTGWPGPAYAHNRLRSADPAAGATAATAPARVTLEFSERLDAKFTAVAVTDTRNVSVVDGPVQINGFKATQPLKAALAPGQYTVAYRVTSQDGHTVSDAYVFTLAAPPGTASSSAPVATMPTPGTVTDPPVRASGPGRGDRGRLGWLAAGAGLVVLFGAGTAIAVRRRRRTTPA